jgi:hypothetical protein
MSFAATCVNFRTGTVPGAPGACRRPQGAENRPQTRGFISVFLIAIKPRRKKTKFKRWLSSALFRPPLAPRLAPTGQVRQMVQNTPRSGPGDQLGADTTLNLQGRKKIEHDTTVEPKPKSREGPGKTILHLNHSRKAETILHLHHSRKRKVEKNRYCTYNTAKRPRRAPHLKTNTTLDPA